MYQVRINTDAYKKHKTSTQNWEKGTLNLTNKQPSGSEAFLRRWRNYYWN